MPSSNTPITSANTNGGNNGQGRAYSNYIPLPAAPISPPPAEDFAPDQVLELLKRRLGIFVGVAVLSFGGLTYRYLTQPPVYSGSADLLVEPVNATASPLSLGTPSPFFSTRGQGLDYTSQIRVLRGPAVLDPIVANIQQRYPQITYQRLLGRLTIAQDGEAKVLRISYSDTDPEVAAFVLAQVVDGFIAYSVDDRQGDLRRGLVFLDEQLEEKWQEVTAIENNLSEFQKQYDLVNLPATSESVTQRMNMMLGQQESLRVELASRQSLYNTLQDQVGVDPETAIRVANLNNSLNYQTLLGELRLIEQTIATESARFQADTPMIEALEDKRQQLLPLLEDEARRLIGDALDADTLGYQGTVSLGLMQQLVDTANQIQVLQTQDQALGEAVQQLRAEIQRLADLAQVYHQISRELAVTESSLTELLTSRQNMRLEMAQQVSPWELISPLNGGSVGRTSNLSRTLMLNAAVSLLLGGMAAFLRDRMDQAFHNTEDLAKLTKLPNLALVPNAPGLKSQPLLIDPSLSTTAAELAAQSANPDKLYSSFSFAEAFYSLDANLRLLSSDTPLQVVALTSSEPGEGKSTMCAHLAIAAANMGRRVLLIDGDLRKPTQHLLFGLSNRQGLSELLTQPTEPSLDMAQAIAGNPNLHVLTAGTRPPAPGRLLSSRKMQQVTEQFRSVYDLVIFDTPPLSGMIDAKLTAANVDGLLLVVRLKKSLRSEIQRVLTDLSNTVQAPLLGVVVNGVPQRRRKGNYDYYYGYHNQQRRVPELEESS